LIGISVIELTATDHLVEWYGR